MKRKTKSQKHNIKPKEFPQILRSFEKRVHRSMKNNSTRREECSCEKRNQHNNQNKLPSLRRI
jgi:hypothetical protein